MSADQTVTLEWAQPSEAIGYTLHLGSPSVLPPPMPQGYRRLDRALSRLESVVTVWERALEPGFAYTVTYTGLKNGQTYHFPPSREPEDP